ncbi:MAG: NUDIX hydrolase [Oscillospiraceae bacterium]|nr:NUDIX hydrolase [Oscillospiraceae bacterium]
METNCMPRRIDRNVVYKNDFVCLYTDKVELPDGQIIEKYHQIHYPHESVSVVLFNENNEILLIHSKRYTVNRLEWEIPAGRIESGETKEQAAERECFEETGCKLNELKFLCSHNPSNGMSDEVCHVFSARINTELSEFDCNEVNEKRWFSKEQCLSMIRNNETMDGVSILAILYALQFYE